MASEHCWRFSCNVPPCIKALVTSRKSLASLSRSSSVEMLAGFEELVPGYLARQRRDVSGMISLLAASDYDRLEVLGHNMKGSGASYGFAELTRFGAELETAAMEADHDALASKIPQLDDYLSRVQLVAG
jgi:HPt (histidine-containing phosphotransfer) domain-containing protein